MTNRRKFLKRAGLAAGGVGLSVAAGLGYGMAIEPERLRLVQVRIPLPHLPTALDGFKIALLSDFHLYPHTQLGLISEAVELANGLKPDLVLLGGDYVLANAEAIFDLAPALAQLNAKLGVFSILGNHDHWRGLEVIVQGLQESGIPLLRNNGVMLGSGAGEFFLAGVDDGWVRQNDLPASLSNRKGELPTIVLMHEPDFADAFSADGRIDLQLSGHSHGGQVRFPLIGSPFLPPYGRKYDKGLYQVGAMRLFTTVGIGVTAPIRLNCPPEVAEITLTAGDQ